MTRAEYEEVIGNVAANYGTRLEKIHIDTIWMEFFTQPIDRFKKIVFLVFKNNKYPPKLAEFAVAAKELKDWELSQSRVTPLKELPDPAAPFFPSDEWIDLHESIREPLQPKCANHRLLNGEPDPGGRQGWFSAETFPEEIRAQDSAAVKKMMQHLRAMAKLNYASFTQQSPHVDESAKEIRKAFNVLLTKDMLRGMGARTDEEKKI